VRETGGQGKASGKQRPSPILADNNPIPYFALQSSKQAETSRLQEELAKVWLLGFS
jgi:hypothetical protein